MNENSNLNIAHKILPDNGKKIMGVELIERKVHSDDRGHLTEIYRIDEDYHKKYGLSIGQIYVVEDEERGIIRGFHKHIGTSYSFYVANGTAKFVLIDDRVDSKTYGVANEYILSKMNRKLLIVPPGVFNGWMSLTRDTHVIGITSVPYNRENPDDKRVLPNSFGYEWEVKAR